MLIGYQNEMFEVIRSETPADLVELHVRLLAKTARALWHADRTLDRGREDRLQRVTTLVFSQVISCPVPVRVVRRQVPGLTVAETTGT